MKKILLAATFVLMGAFGGQNDIRDEGVGMYTDASVANQVSTFTINRNMVSCGVAAGAGAAPGLFSAGFAMLMYSKDIQLYSVDHNTKTIQAQGRMRSITRVGPDVVDDIEHDFLAVAVDGNPDRFDVHFSTPFWKPGNPMCTASTVWPGKCRFGGALLPGMGDVNVSP